MVKAALQPKLQATPALAAADNIAEAVAIMHTAIMGPVLRQELVHWVPEVAATTAAPFLLIGGRGIDFSLSNFYP